MIRTRIAIAALFFGSLLTALIGCGGKAESEKSEGDGSPKAVKPSAKTPIDTAYISDEYIGAIILHPSRMLANKEILASLNELGGPQSADEIFQVAVKEFGVDPRTLEQTIVLIDGDYVNAAPMMFSKKEKRGERKRGFSKTERFDRGKKTEEIPPNKTDDEKKIDDCLVTAQPKSGPDRKSPAGKEPPFGEVEEFDAGPQPSFIVRFTKAPDQAAFMKMIAKQLSGPGEKNPPALPTGTHAGKTYHTAGPLTYCFVDDKTLLGGPLEKLKKMMISAKGVTTPLTKRLSTLGAEHDLIVAVAGPQFEQQLQMLKSLPITLPDEYKNVPTLISSTKSLALTFSLTSDPMFSIVLELGNEGSAKELTQIVNDHALPSVKSEVEKELEDKPSESVKMVKDLLANITVSHDGPDFVASIKRHAAADKLPQQLMASVREAREAARRATRKNSLKQIGIAFHNFHDQYNRFPAHNSNGAYDDKERKEGLSWRVHLLPQLGREDLYERFKLDEPWDSPHNKELIREMPGVYVSPFDDGHATVEGKTSLHVFIGPAGSQHSTPFSAGFQKKFVGYKFRDITDGTSNTLFVVDAGADKAEIWTKPGGLPFDPEKDPKLALGKVQKAGFLALFADGSVRLLPNTIPAETLKIMLGHRDGKVVPEF